MPELVDEIKITRQALKKHLDELEDVDLIIAKPSRRGALPATEYRTNPAGLFAFKENVRGIAVFTDPRNMPPLPTITVHHDGSTAPTGASGLLLVHGDQPGKWFGMPAAGNVVIGRDVVADVPLVYDACASSRHALLRRGPSTWTLTDLRSTNGTTLNYRPVPPGQAITLRSGDLITIGRSHLLFRDGA